MLDARQSFPAGDCVAKAADRHIAETAVWRNEPDVVDVPLETRRSEALSVRPILVSVREKIDTVDRFIDQLRHISLSKSAALNG